MKTGLSLIFSLLFAANIVSAQESNRYEFDSRPFKFKYENGSTFLSFVSADYYSGSSADEAEHIASLLPVCENVIVESSILRSSSDNAYLLRRTLSTNASLMNRLNIVFNIQGFDQMSDADILANYQDLTNFMINFSKILNANYNARVLRPMRDFIFFPNAAPLIYLEQFVTENVHQDICRIHGRNRILTSRVANAICEQRQDELRLKIQAPASGFNNSILANLCSSEAGRIRFISPVVIPTATLRQRSLGIHAVPGNSTGSQLEVLTTDY